MSNIIKTKSFTAESIIIIVSIIFVQSSLTYGYGHDRTDIKLLSEILPPENSQSLELFVNKPEQSEPLYMKEKLPAGWIDPFDMSVDEDSLQWIDYSFDEKLKTYKDPSLYADGPSVKTNHCPKYVSYFQRFVNLILKAVNVKKSRSLSSSVELVNIEFIITERDLSMLKDFAEKGEKGGTKIEYVSDILGRIVPREPKDEQSSFNFETVFKMARYVMEKLISSSELIVVFTTLMMLFITLWLAKYSSCRMFMSSLFITIFFFGYGFTWMRLYEEKEVEKYLNFAKHGNAPYHCTGSKLEWYELMYYSAFGVDCLEFHKVRDVRPILKISPSDVLVETVSSMLIKPSKNCGQAYGEFIYSVTDSAPFLLKPIAVVMGFIMPLCFLMLLLCFLFSYEIRLSLFGFYLIPRWFSNKLSVKEHTCRNEKYIEEVSRTTNCQKVNSCSVSKATFVESKKPLLAVNNLMTNVNNEASETQKPNCGCNKSIGENLETIDKELSNIHFCPDQKDDVLKFEDGDARDVEEEFCLISLQAGKFKVNEQYRQHSSSLDHSTNSNVEDANITALK